MAPQDDLTAERAAIALLEQMGLYGHPAASQFVGDIIAALKAARQEALIDVMRLHKEWRAGKHSGLFSDLLDRLASEGG